ncbi:U1 small nuclear ribonucleoprotein of 70kDa MW N terminal-domain-containing protein, partial [Peziza echinospora]
MTDKLPPNLLALFQPRPPLRYLAPCDHAPEQRRTPRVTGVAQYLEAFRNSEDNYVPTESVMQRRERLREEKKQAAEQKVKEALEKYHPAEDPQIRGDPYKTLFVSRLSYEVKESDLEREFGRFGPIERIRIVRSKDPNSKKPHRGYAFIVYEREKDMKAAYKETDGIRIKDRRVLVDVERGRTVKGWKPRRLGGGLGGRGYTKAPISRPSGPAGGFDRFGGPPRGGGFGGRGGFRGGPGGPGGPGGFGGGGRGGGGFGGRGGFDGPRGPRGGIGYQ